MTKIGFRTLTGIKMISICLSVLTVCGADAMPNLHRKQGVLERQLRIKVGQKITVQDTDLKITFLGVPEDSRCPAHSACVWRGNAIVELEVVQHKEKGERIKLNTLFAKGHESERSPKDKYPFEVRWAGFNIKLVGLDPERATSEMIRKEDYEATLFISRSH